MTDEQVERVVVALETIAACTKAQFENQVEQGRMLQARFEEAAKAEKVQAEATREIINTTKRAGNVVESGLNEALRLPRKRGGT